MRNFGIRFGIWTLCAMLGSTQIWAAELVKVTGTVAGFSDLTTDNVVDGALVLPSLSSEDLFQFQVDQFMGPNESMSVGGIFSADVPSNLFLPNQREKYGFFPVSFAKEHFSIFAVPGEKRELIGAWFQVPWDKLLDMNNNEAPATDLLPLIKIKKHAYAAERDWTTVSSISLNLDKSLSSAVQYKWQRGNIASGEMDTIFLFQGTSTERWVFANLRGKPETQGSIESVKGLVDKFKLLFIRTHTLEKDIAAAEGYIRNATLADTVVVSNLPPALSAKLVSPSRIDWTAIDAPGWISLVYTPKEEEARSFKFLDLNGIFGGAFGRIADQEQIWLDPNAGTAQTGLNSSTIKDVNIMMAFIGTTEEVEMPTEGGDNTAFINSASEIRMKKLQ